MSNFTPFTVSILDDTVHFYIERDGPRWLARNADYAVVEPSLEALCEALKKIEMTARGATWTPEMLANADKRAKKLIAAFAEAE